MFLFGLLKTGHKKLFLRTANCSLKEVMPSPGWSLQLFEYQAMKALLSYIDSMFVWRRIVQLVHHLACSCLIGIVLCCAHPLLLQVNALCVLDFYVSESCQRSGVGHQLFRAMLEHHDVQAEQLAYDRPSPKLLSFIVILTSFAYERFLLVVLLYWMFHILLRHGRRKKDANVLLRLYVSLMLDRRSITA